MIEREEKSPKRGEKLDYPKSCSAGVRAEDGRNEMLRSYLRGFSRYLYFAVLLLALLTLFGTKAADFPTFALPFIVLLYAIPATIGAMFDVVAKRAHRQFKLNESGALSRYNRKWCLWFAGFFVFYLASGLLFMLQAPSWNGNEWLLMWVAIPGYYFVYLLVGRFHEKEYAPRFYKASAIKWSVVIMAGVLCLAYAGMSFAAVSGPEISIAAMIENRSMPFAGSECALLAEADKLTSYSDCLWRYGLEQIEGTSHIAAFVVNLVLSAPVFLGITSQLGCGLLSREEVKSEFQLLPTADQSCKDSPVLLRYFAIAFGIWLAFSLVFVWAEGRIEDMRATGSYTIIDAKLDELTDWVVLASEHSGEEVVAITESVTNANDFNKAFKQKADERIRTSLEPLKEQINTYYDTCVGNVDSYIEWRDGFFGFFAKLIKPVGEGAASDEFTKRVIEPVSREELDRSFEAYIAELKALYDEYYLSEEIQVIDSPFGLPTSDEVASSVVVPPALWPHWDSGARSDITWNVLLNTDGDVDIEELKAKIVDLINQERNQVLSEADGLAAKFLPNLGVL